MSKTGSFLWKLFCAIVMFFYHKPSDADVSTDLYTKKLCPSPNQFVVSCSGIPIRTESLKNARFRAATVKKRYIPPLSIGPYGAENLSNTEKSIALRYFLDTAGFKYRYPPKEHPSHPSGSPELETVLNAIDTANKDHIETHQNYIDSTPENHLLAGDSVTASVAGDLLTLLCADTKKVKCDACPDGGVVDDSLYLYDQFSIYANTWKIYTIADCYKYELSNTNGTYSYYESESSQEPYKFYYNISNDHSTDSTTITE
jgi:hypothetical protein